jgi:hypothetical protein
LREEPRPRVFENRVLRGIFGSERDEVTGEWRKLHNKELNYLYCSPNICRVVKSRMRWAEHVARMGERRAVYRGLMGQSEGKRPLGRPRCRRGIILKWIFRKWDVVIWTGLIWLRIETGGRAVVNMVMNLQVP